MGAAAIAAALAPVAGCGTARSGSGAAASSSFVRDACSPRTVAVIARNSGRPAASITRTAFVAPSGAASCRYHGPGARGPDITVGIDTAPQVLYRLDRQVVEIEQNVIWGHQGSKFIPQYIPHLGKVADWLPSLQELVSTDGLRMVSVSLSRSMRLGAVEDVARLYLRSSHPGAG